jgi:CheY-like chemotaxis protein
MRDNPANRGRKYPLEEAGVILVIDDEPVMTELLRDILEYRGHPVIVANDAQTAMDLIPLQRPDLILMDLMMPSVDGLSLALALRHNPCATGVPLVAISASDSALSLADQMGDFDAYIAKPFENDAIVDTVERLMRVAS